MRIEDMDGQRGRRIVRQDLDERAAGQFGCDAVARDLNDPEAEAGAGDIRLGAGHGHHGRRGDLPFPVALGENQRTDEARAAEYASGPYAGIADKALKGLAGLEPADADPDEVARAIVRVVDAPFGKRPFRVHVDPSQDGAEIVNGVADRMRREIYRTIGLENLLHPAINA